MIDSGTLARLVALGRAKGHLTSQDLEKALPVETMGADDIALVVVHLEDAGVPVELDPRLTEPSPGTHPPTLPSEMVGLAEFDDTPRRALDQAVSFPESSTLPVAPKPGPWGDPRVHKSVLLAGVLMALLATVVFLLGR